MRVARVVNLHAQRKRTDMKAAIHDLQAGSVGRPSIARCELERTCWDPKDGELWVSRAKAGETLLEARNNTDVQIVCLTCL